MNDAQTLAPTDTDKSMDEYLDKLISEKGFPELTDEVYEQIHKDLKQRLVDTINAKMIAALSDKDVPGFQALLDNNAADEELQQYMTDHIPDSETFLTNVLLDFRKTYLGLV